MNYRHAYHAGNHADVLKHAVLARLLVHMKKKDKPFLVLDAHAGSGLYDLHGIEAGKTGEWETGIGKLGEAFPADVEALLQPYRDVLAGLNAGPAIRYYPGSPELVLRLLRPADRLIANELHPEEAISLERHFLRDARVDVTSMDAQICIKSRLPPPQRRGVVLIDPPYELKDEVQRVGRMMGQGLRRFAQGVFVVWYPVKADGTAGAIVEQARAMGIAGTLNVELKIREAFTGGGLAGSGLVIINTPWKLDEELQVLVPALAARLGLGTWGHAAIDWLVPPV